MDLPTYTNIWRIEKRLYKLYDFRLPMPLPINWIAVFAAITIPYIVLLIAIGLPFNHTLVWLYVLPPGLITWLTTRPVIENKRLPELVESQARYLSEPKTWVRFAPLSEKDQMVVNARVWHSSRTAVDQAAKADQPAPVGQEAKDVRARRTPSRASRAVPAAKRGVATGKPARSRSSARGLGGPQSVPVLPQVRSVDPLRPPRRSVIPARAMPDPAPSQGAPSSAVQVPVQPERWPSAESRPVDGMPVRTRGGASTVSRLEMSHDGPGRRPVVVVPPKSPVNAVRPMPPEDSVHAWPAAARPLRPVRLAPPIPLGAGPMNGEDIEPAPERTPPSGPAPAPEPTPPADQTPQSEQAFTQDADAPVYEQEQEQEPTPAPEPADLPGAEVLAEVDVQPISEAAPEAFEVVPEAPEPAPEAFETAPEAFETAPESPEAAPEAFEAAPESPETAPEASEAAPEWPEVVPEALETVAEAPEAVPAAPDQTFQPDNQPDQSLQIPQQPPAQQAKPAQSVDVTASVEETVRRTVPSIERALSAPSRDRNLSWHSTVKIVTGGGAAQGPGARDQEALDRNRARLPIDGPKRILILGCTTGAGQSVTALMTGYMLASLREQPVAAVDLHDGTLARYRAPAAWLDELLAGKPPQAVRPTRPDGLHPTPKASPARFDVIASHEPLGDGDEIKLAVQLNRHYPLTVLDGGPAGLTKLLKVTDQLVLVAPANVEAAGALADTRDWLDAHGYAELAMQSVTVINGVSRRSLPDVEQAESIARGRSRAIVRVPWDDMLPVAATGPSTLRPQTRVAYSALAGVLVAGLAAAPARAAAPVRKQ